MTTAEIDSEAFWPDDAQEVDEGVVATWFVREGASVTEGDTLCEIQIEKVSIDVPAPTDGDLVEIERGEDDELSRDDTLGWLVPG